MKQLLQAVHDNGRDDIYLGTYEGLYCVSCEAYYTEERAGRRAPARSTSRPVERLRRRTTSSASPPTRDRLLEHYDGAPRGVQPEVRRNEVLSLDPAEACRTSRSAAPRSTGACPLPWDPEHVMLRLVRRAHELRHGGRLRRATPSAFARVWPADVHLDRQGHPPVPRRLLAGDADGGRASSRPTQVWAHGFLLVGGEKMSKTQAHGHPSLRAARPLRRRLLPLLLHAGDPVRSGRQLLAGRR